MMTGATAVTCSSFRNTSATLTGTGAPVIPVRNEDPGGDTSTSAPMPLVRSALSRNMPVESPTISRIRVTSMAMAVTLMAVRTGR